MDPVDQTYRRHSSGLAIAALVTGIFSLCLTPLGLVAVVLGIVAVIQISKTANLLIGRCCVRLAGRRSHYRRVSRTVESKTVPLNLGGKVMWSVEPSESNHMPQLQLAFRFRPILLKKVPALGAARPDLAAQIVAACWAQRYSAPKQLLPERSA